MLIVTLAIDVEEGDVANWTAMAAGRDFCMSEKAVHQIGSLVAHAAAVAADETKTANEASSRDPGFDRDAALRAVQNRFSKWQSDTRKSARAK